MTLPDVNDEAVFLNVPYDERFSDLFLAYVVGLCQMGLEPRVTLGIGGGERRLNRILELIQGCRYSIHDLSRVEVDNTFPLTPRFNMPFELGLTISWQMMKPKRHTWFVFESQGLRLQKSLSDLNGTDPNIHDGTVEGIMRELCNAFVRRSVVPTVPQMMSTYQRTASQLPQIMVDAGAGNLFQAAVFSRLCFVARANAELT